jgi:hypothetical protein
VLQCLQRSRGALTPPRRICEIVERAESTLTVDDAMCFGVNHLSPRRVIVANSMIAGACHYKARNAMKGILDIKSRGTFCEPNA